MEGFPYKKQSGFELPKLVPGKRWGSKKYPLGRKIGQKPIMKDDLIWHIRVGIEKEVLAASSISKQHYNVGGMETIEGKYTGSPRSHGS